MVYTSKELTPQKFHRFIWYFWMPASLIVACINAYSAIAEALDYLVPPISAVIIPFLVLTLLEAGFVLAPILIFIGFFKWRKYAWLILMFLSVSNIITSPILMLLNTTFSFGKVVGIVIDIVIVIYYWKRRALFSVYWGNAKFLQKTSTGEKNLESNFCRFCGKKLPPESIFCNACGKKL